MSSQTNMKYNDIIYQIFPRNHSYQGGFKSIEKDLNRVKDLGVDIIYLMPIHIIGEVNRKGIDGSPYAIKDYFSISPELGDINDFKSLVNKVHALGMTLILDMVFNHTSPDNVLLKEHEDYYYHKNGKLSNRVGDWSDIVDLDTFKQETQSYLISVLQYWVSLGVDGFRFDVASMIPLSLFIKAREILGKDIIFIGESIDPEFASYLRSINDPSTPDDEMYPTFDSLYNYNYFRAFQRYLSHKGTLKELVNLINLDGVNQRLICLENHDNDRIASILNKDKLEKWLDFFSFIKGQIFIYAGQEYGNEHKPDLFNLDPVDLTYINQDIYRIYKDYINRKKKQKEITYQFIELINEDIVEVTVKYIDGQTIKKTFILPN